MAADMMSGGASHIAAGVREAPANNAPRETLASFPEPSICTMPPAPSSAPPRRPETVATLPLPPPAGSAATKGRTEYSFSDHPVLVVNPETGEAMTIKKSEIGDYEVLLRQFAALKRRLGEPLPDWMLASDELPILGVDRVSGAGVVVPKEQRQAFEENASAAYVQDRVTTDMPTLRWNPGATLGYGVVGWATNDFGCARVGLHAVAAATDVATVVTASAGASGRAPVAPEVPVPAQPSKPAPVTAEALANKGEAVIAQLNAGGGAIALKPAKISERAPATVAAGAGGGSGSGSGIGGGSGGGSKISGPAEPPTSEPAGAAAEPPAKATGRGTRASGAGSAKPSKRETYSFKNKFTKETESIPVIDVKPPASNKFHRSNLVVSQIWHRMNNGAWKPYTPDPGEYIPKVRYTIDDEVGLYAWIDESKGLPQVTFFTRKGDFFKPHEKDNDPLVSWVRWRPKR